MGILLGIQGIYRQYFLLIRNLTITMSQKQLEDIEAQNNDLQMLINSIRSEPKEHSAHQQVIMSQDINLSQFERKKQTNEQKINELKATIQEQQNALKEFSANLNNVVKLDQDIHSKLHNSHSPALQKNVRNVIVALTAKAPYDKVIKMIENIKI